ncbi:MAG: cell division protein FtsL [Clostridiales bacterium]|nr:cell division protein FtsL [Clostridiales bacterium]
MAAGQRTPIQSEYVYGNTVRKKAPSVQTQREERREYQRQQRISRTVRRNQERALHMDLPYVLLLTAAALCALFICVSYLHVQSTITARISHIEQLEQQLEQLREENDTLQTRINTDIDLDHIYQVATEELGMVYANKDQVILYDKTESEYVRQYEDIPRN